jgi:excisionase family DNA binding protein
MTDPPRDPHIPDLVSLKEAAEILGVSRQMTHKLAVKGELRGARVGEAWAFRRVAVQRMRDKARSDKQ